MKLFKNLFSPKDKNSKEDSKKQMNKQDPHETWKQLDAAMTKFADECEAVDSKIEERFKKYLEVLTNLERECLELVNLERQVQTKNISINEDTSRYVKRILAPKPFPPHSRGRVVFLNQLSSAISFKDASSISHFSNHAMPYIKLPIEIPFKSVPSASDIVKPKSNRFIKRPFSSVIDSAKGNEGRTIPLSTGTGSVDAVWGMDIHPVTGNVYVGSQRTGAVHAFSSPESGSPQLVFTLKHEPPIRQVSVIRISPDGSRFAVVDFTSHHLHVFGAYDGEHIGSYTGSGQATPLSYALAVVFDSANNMYVADSSNRRILRLGPDASFIGSFSDQRIGRAQGLAIDGKGRLWVLAIAGKCINVFNLSDGTFITSYKFPGVSDVWPNSLANGPEDSILAVDWSGNHIFQVDSTSGDLKNTLTINRPSAVAYGLDGSFYLTSYSAGLRVL